MNKIKDYINKCYVTNKITNIKKSNYSNEIKIIKT